MAKKRKGRHPKKEAGGGRTTPKGTRPGDSASRPRFDPDGAPPLGSTAFGGPSFGPWGGSIDRDVDDPMFDDELDIDPEDVMGASAMLAEVFGADEPHGLLSLASSLLDVDDPRSKDPFSRDQEPASPPLPELVDGLLAMGAPEAIGLAVAFTHLAPDDLLHRRISRAFPPERLSGPGFPEWLANLGDVEVTRVVEQTHVLGDGDDLLLGGTIAGHPFAALVYIDHNSGTVAADGLVSFETLDQMLEAMVEAAGDRIDDHRFIDIDLADARAKLTEAIDHGAMVVPRIETDSWPDCRPLVEWLARHLPEGGESYIRPEWPEDDIARLIDDFMASPEGAPFDDGLHRSHMETLIWFGTDYGPGDPMRWSEVSVEILLEDWIPRKISADPEFLSHVPDLLRGFVRYCHRVREIPADLTDDVLDSVDRCEPTYQQLIRSDRPQGPAALLASLGLLDDAGDADEDDRAVDWLGPRTSALAAAQAALREALADPVGTIRENLEERAGGPEALAALDGEPLPDEAFDWTGVPADVRDRVAETLDLLDRFADEHMDIEFRTASRRLLAIIARDGAVAFRRKGAAATAAAAIAWLVARGNRLLAIDASRGMYAKDLVAAFGAKGSVSGRAGGLLRAAGLDELSFEHRIPPAMLTSVERARLVSQRDDLPRLAELLQTMPPERFMDPLGFGGLGGSGALGGGLRPPEAAAGPVGPTVRDSDRPATKSTHVLKVTLAGTKPPVWRRLEVPSNATLGDLHQIIQVAFGWTGSHLHSFEIGGERFEPETPVGGFGSYGPEPHDEDGFTIDELLDEGDRATYTYDFGDDWEHRVQVESIEPRPPGSDHPVCTAGRRAGPPEDVGGIWGFETFVAAMADPTHPEHADLLAWHGGPFDPKRVDKDAINAWFRSNTEPR